MELKGFGANTYKNMKKQELGIGDYLVLTVVIILSTYKFWVKYL